MLWTAVLSHSCARRQRLHLAERGLQISGQWTLVRCLKSMEHQWETNGLMEHQWKITGKVEHLNENHWKIHISMANR